MQNVTITIKKTVVLEEVAKTTAYMGAKSKLKDGTSAYDQVFVTDKDRDMVERFWMEAVGIMTDTTRRFITSVDNTSNYVLNLAMSERYDTNLNDSIHTSMFSFFVSYIISKWCEIVSKDDAKEYSDMAVAMLASVKDKIFYKTKPKRIKII